MAGATLLSVGAGFTTSKVMTLDSAPPGAGLTTLREAVVVVVSRPAGTVARSTALGFGRTPDVVSLVAFQYTVAGNRGLVLNMPPVTSRSNAAPPTVARAGLSDVMYGPMMTGCVMVKTPLRVLLSGKTCPRSV